MLENGNAIVFNDIDLPFDPIIEVVSTFKLIYKQAALFEFAVGRGKLLICTLHLDINDVAAMYLLDKFLRYVQSEHFNPGNSIKIADLEHIMRSEYGPYGILSTDMAFDPNAQ